MRAYKLFNQRKDGSIGPLFINRPLRLVPGEWHEAEDHPTKGYAHRPGWHCCSKPLAPHLSENGRVWWEVEIEGVMSIKRPECQGGTWLLADRLKPIRPL